MSDSLVANTIAGLVAGAASTIAMHPLDLIKTRMQVSGGSTRQVFSSVYAQQGFKGLYRGLGTNLIGGTLGWSCYFAWYGQVKNWMSHGDRLSGPEYLIASATAGILTSICTNPIWVVKTRMLTTNHGTGYTSFTDGILQISRTEGLAGLYRGLVPSLFGVAHGALQFGFYESLKTAKGDMSTLDYLQISAISKLGATVLTYPYQVVRSRLQVHGAESLTLRIVLKKVMEDGLLSFYRGLTPNLVRVIPSTCITMVVYEEVNRRLR